MSARSFVDTNILVYCFDTAEPEKRARALDVLGGAHGPDLVLSTQVLQEFYVTVVRKLATPLSPEQAERAVRDLAALPIVQVDAEMVFQAIGTSRRHQLSLWDALVLEAAVASACTRLLTEDLQHGFEYRGLRVVNPLLDPS